MRRKMPCTEEAQPFDGRRVVDHGEFADLQLCRGANIPTEEDKAQIHKLEFHFKIYMYSQMVGMDSGTATATIKSMHQAKMPMDEEAFGQFIENVYQNNALGDRSLRPGVTELCIMNHTAIKMSWPIFGSILVEYEGSNWNAIIILSKKLAQTLDEQTLKVSTVRRDIVNSALQRDLVCESETCRGKVTRFNLFVAGISKMDSGTKKVFSVKVDIY
jgi:hypothetical protein